MIKPHRAKVLFQMILLTATISFFSRNLAQKPNITDGTWHNITLFFTHHYEKKMQILSIKEDCRDNVFKIFV